MFGLASVAGGQIAPAATVSRQPVAPANGGLPEQWRTMRKFDVHSHVSPRGEESNPDWTVVDSVIATADLLGIEKLFSSKPVAGGAMASIEVVRAGNDAVLATMKRHPKRVFGYCFVQPGNGAAALEEIDRCYDQGMIGVKLYNQFRYSDPVVFPIAEKCIERRILFIGHSAFLTDPRTLASQPRTSHSLDYCALSKRYPELMLILGHVNGGGDWEWAIKGLRECPNVFVDTSGSVLEDDTIGRCVRELGHQRMLFGTDMTMEGGVGKILSAELTPAQREDIFWRNLQKLLDRRTA